jgi:hypothetical protein
MHRQLKRLREEIAECKRLDILHDDLFKEYKRLRLIRLNAEDKKNYSLRYRYKKLMYIRYADDFLIGVIGSKHDADDIRDRCTVFLKEELNLELSDEKTLITHSSKKARFLSYDVSVFQTGLKRKMHNAGNPLKETRTVASKQIELRMPAHIIRDKLLEHDLVVDIDTKALWKSKTNPRLLTNSDLEIVQWYNEQIRGLYNYYRLAVNVSQLMNSYYWVMKMSYFHTMASKYKTTIKKIQAKYRIPGTNDFEVKYQTLSGEKSCKLYHEGFRRNRYVAGKRKGCTEDLLPNSYKFLRGNELEKRIMANQCEWCGKMAKCHIHHINAMKNVKNKSDPMSVYLARRNRKTAILCPECHLLQRTGKLPPKQIN